jgi:hypothetical protein
VAVLISPDHRVSLSDQYSVAAVPELEAVFIGDAATSPVFAAASGAVAAGAQLGFEPEPGDLSLTNLPLAFSSAASFAAAFPGDDGWLARGVRDYFNAGGQRAWIIRVVVDPNDPLRAYMRPNMPAITSPPLTGVEIAMQVPSVGLLLMPDLEYLCLASMSPPPSSVPSVPPPPPGFRPAADFVAPPPAVNLPPVAAIAPVLPNSVLARVSSALQAIRPDMLCLFALPAGADQTLSVPALVTRVAAYLHGDAGTGPDLTQVQAFAPLLRDPSGAIASPSGMIAGVLSASAQTDGVWRSIAGRTLPLGGTPLRRIESNALDTLRKSGVATLRFAPGGTVLDDDILACSSTRPGSAARRSAGTRRLMGWLLRNLRRFGEQLVFENVLDNGIVELILMDLFGTLQKRGALNGRQVADAVTITRRAATDTAVAFDIAIDTALAVETIRLRFLDGTLTATPGGAA